MNRTSKHFGRGARMTMVIGGGFILLLIMAVIFARRMQPPDIEAETWNTPEGVRISILGDSISTFKWYIPAADGLNPEHECFYPKRDVRKVEDTWWAQVIMRMNGRLGINESWSGSRVLNTIDGNEGNVGEDAAMASMTRIRNLGSRDDPDIILFFGGTNDISFGSPLGEFHRESAPQEVDLTATKWDTYADAYVAAILRMQALYPDAEIYAISPTENETYYSASTRLRYVSVMKEICDHYGVTFIDLVEEGFTTDLLFDGTHPNREGMTRMADIVMTYLQE